MTEHDPHAPTTAGPVPVEPEAEPTPVVGAADATAQQPAGSAAVGGSHAAAASPAQPDPHPEKVVGAAFGGGLVAALFLKSLAKRKHR